MSALYPITVQGVSPQNRVVLGAGKLILTGAASLTLNAADMTPSVVNQISGLLGASTTRINVTDPNGTAFTKALWDTTFGVTTTAPTRPSSLGGLPMGTSPAPLADQASGQQDNLLSHVVHGLAIADATTTANRDNNDVAGHILDIAAGAARVGGVFWEKTAASADYAMGTNGVQKDGTTAAVVLSGAAKQVIVTAVLLVATDETLLGDGSPPTIPVFIYGDEDDTGSAVALTDAELQTACEAFATAASKTLDKFIKIAEITATSASGTNLAYSITNSRPTLAVALS